MLIDIGDVMRRCYEKGWITTRDGNVSIRKEDSNFVYITPSGVRKHKIQHEDIIKLEIRGDKLITPANVKVSGEFHMHLVLQNIDNLKNRCVLHVHATNIVAAMYAGWNLQKIAEQFPEVNRYTKVGPNVPTLPAVSQELSEATFLSLTKTIDNKSKIVYDIVGQAQHGVCAVGSSPWDAYEHIERLDHICEIVLKSGVKP